MRKIALAFAVSLLLACGSEDSPATLPPTSNQAIDGTWLYLTSSVNGAIELTFTGGNFHLRALEALTDGTFGVQLDGGTYTLSGSILSLTRTSSSCSGLTVTSKTTGTETVIRQGNSLTITSSTNQTVLQLETSPPTCMDTATIGCFVSDTSFQAHPVMQLN